MTPKSARKLSKVEGKAPVVEEEEEEEEEEAEEEEEDDDDVLKYSEPEYK